MESFADAGGDSQVLQQGADHPAFFNKYHNPGFIDPWKKETDDGYGDEYGNKGYNKNPLTSEKNFEIVLPIDFFCLDHIIPP